MIFSRNNEIEKKMEILEYGKIMKLHGLSATQWNDSIVDIVERLDENGQIRYICEVILGDNKGKKLKVKEVNIMEVPPPPPEQLKHVNEKCAELYVESSVQTSTSLNIERLNKLLAETHELIKVVPNCCVLWHLLTIYGK